MPNRIIRESICTSDSVDKLSWFEEVLFYRLIVNCDDFGRFDGRAAVVKNRLFPLKENLTLKTVENALHGLASAGLIALYVFEGKRFLYLPTWGKYQTQRAKVSKYPSPDEHAQESANTCKQMIADVPVFENRESGYENRESRGENTRVTRFTPPTVEEVKTYCRERKNSVDAERFVDYYSANGWIVGKTKMKDWKAAVRTWERRDSRGTGTNASGAQTAARDWNLDAIVL